VELHLEAQSVDQKQELKKAANVAVKQKPEDLLLLKLQVQSEAPSQVKNVDAKPAVQPVLPLRQLPRKPVNVEDQQVPVRRVLHHPEKAGAVHAKWQLHPPHEIQYDLFNKEKAWSIDQAFFIGQLIIEVNRLPLF
jgi:hypothetical protein